MRDGIEMPKGTFYTITLVCAAIILLTSIDMLFRAKDTALFEMWLSNPNINPDILAQPEAEIYSTYLNMCIGTFIMRVITPMALAIHSYYTFTKLRVNKLFIAIWSVILIGAFILSSLGEPFYSIFFIGSAVGYIALIITMIYLWKCIRNVRCI